MTLRTLTITVGVAALMGTAVSCGNASSESADNSAKNFLRVDGPNIVDANGEVFYIKGTNTGNWLNPEGYMFGFGRTTSPFMINEAFCELVGPTAAA